MTVNKVQFISCILFQSFIMLEQNRYFSFKRSFANSPVKKGNLKKKLPALLVEVAESPLESP